MGILQYRIWLMAYDTPDGNRALLECFCRTFYAICNNHPSRPATIFSIIPFRFRSMRFSDGSPIIAFILDLPKEGRSLIQVSENIHHKELLTMLLNAVFVYN
jgi:hypothetical protein